MLVLHRKPGQAIVLNDIIKIYVLRIEGDRVKIGIEAPPDVIVVREELQDDYGPPAPFHRDQGISSG